MLTSLKSHEDDETAAEIRSRHHHHSPNLLIPTAAQARQLLINCAELVYRGDLVAAQRTAAVLSASSPAGDSTSRLIYQFARAIMLRLDRHPTSSADDDASAAYLALNEVTPFIRFAHLTANQAILEAVEGKNAIHILDFDTADGLQWPPFLQDIAGTTNPPSIRITGTGSNLQLLRRTGDRLSEFAASLGLNFEFQPLHLCPHNNNETTTQLRLELRHGETLVINFMHFLNKLLGGGEGSPELMAFLRSVRLMQPAIVTLAEREAAAGDTAAATLPQRVVEALDYYGAIFESLEATLPPGSRDRAAVEQAWFGREIADVVGGIERHGRFERWEATMRAAGFTCRPLGLFALSQAKMLLRLRYPSEGYQIQVHREAFFLGWQNRPLF